MAWTQIRVTCRLEELDTVSAVMSMLDSGLMIEDNSDIKTIYDELLDESIINSDKTKAKVSIFVPEEKNYNDYVAFLRDRFTALSLDVTTELIGVDEEDWATAWKQYYKPLSIGEHITVVPMWEKYEAKPDEVIVRMDPGMAFGTGTHETTRLCMTLIEKHIKAGDKVLDVGTGSGILAIAASKLGAASVDAYDIDPVAVRVARDNVEENGVTNVTCGESDLLAAVQGEYDLVCANIVADIIVRMAPDVAKFMKPGSKVITSGIIDFHTERVKAAMENGGLTLCDTLAENDWTALVFTKK